MFGLRSRSAAGASAGPMLLPSQHSKRTGGTPEKTSSSSGARRSATAPGAGRTGVVRSGVVRISVAPSVRLSAGTDRTSVSGVVKPLLPDAPVQVQRQGAGGWKTVAATTVTSYGAFTASLNLTPGTYRARVVAGKGYAAGLSPVLTVVPA